MTHFSQADLEGYLDEALPAETMTAIEAAVRRQPDLARELAAINARRDAGLHSLGEIWRRHRLSCLTRRELGSYLLSAVSKEAASYIAFHVDVVGCRYCQANLADLKTQQAETVEVTSRRRGKFFQSSAGLLRKVP